MKLVILALSLFSSVALAKFENYDAYSSLTCELKAEDGESLKTFTERFMLVKMDDHMGKFKQMRAEVGLDQIQLQVLLEDDSAKSGEGFVMFLVNFAVNGKEISTEFAGKDVSRLRLRHVDYTAICDLK